MTPQRAARLWIKARRISRGAGRVMGQGDEKTGSNLGCNRQTDVCIALSNDCWLCPFGYCASVLPKLH